MFGDPRHPVPGAKTTLAYVKPPDAGLFGAVAGFRRDWEPVYLVGAFPNVPAARSGSYAQAYATPAAPGMTTPTSSPWT